MEKNNLAQLTENDSMKLLASAMDAIATGFGRAAIAAYMKYEKQKIEEERFRGDE